MIDIRTAVVRADEFMRVTTNALLFASKDDTLPTLTAVHYRPAWEGAPWLMAEATNRYVASQELIGAAHPEHLSHADGSGHDGVCPPAVVDLDVLISGKDAAKLVKTLKLVIDPGTKHLPPAEQPHVRIEHAEGADRVQFTLFSNLDQDVTVSQRTVVGDFPRIDSLIATAMLPAQELDAKLRRDTKRPGYKSAPVADVWEREYVFNPDYLALFTKVVTAGFGSYPGLRVHFTASAKPALVTIGEHFRGLIVPLSTEGGGPVWPSAEPQPEPAPGIPAIPGHPALADRSALIEHLHSDPSHGGYVAGHDFVLVGTQDIVKEHERKHGWSAGPAKAEDAPVPDDAPATAVYTSLPGLPEPQQPVPTVGEITAMLKAAVTDSEVSFDTSCSQGCEVEPDGKCGHGHPTWLRRYGLI